MDRNEVISLDGLLGFGKSKTFECFHSMGKYPVLSMNVYIVAKFVMNVGGNSLISLHVTVSNPGTVFHFLPTT